MAMEKLGQLVAANEWDLIVVDTPPSRSALDFLDAPNRLGRFLDGRMIRVLTAPARAGGKAYLKVVTVSVGVLAKVFTKVLGGDLLSDLSSFVSALESMFGGFRERAQHTYELLKTPGTAFVVVAAPEPDALREASYFVERLSSERMPLAGLVVNRIRETSLPPGTSLPAARAEAAADALAGKPDDPATRLAEAALRVHAELAGAAEHDARMARRFAAAHPRVPMVCVPALPADVHDLDGLRRIGELLGSS
jgi:anion-transporting  ArsA/GET3 family ATPase